jgi:threonine/homoserine/homoserine lactone efflux protein
MARKALLSALHCAPPDASQTRASGSLMTGVIFSLANPAGLAFWSGLGGGMLGASGDLSLEGAALFLVMFVTGALCWGAGMSALVAWGRRFATARIFRIIDALCGMVLSYFGLRLLWSTIQRYGRLVSLLPRALS